MRVLPWFRRRSVSTGLFLALTACAGDSDPTGPAVPSAIVLSSSALSFDALQETTQLTATVHDRHGGVIESATVDWTSSTAAVASVSVDGLVTALSAGSATITARSGSAVGTAAVSVRQIASSIDLSPVLVELQGPGDTATVTAWVSDGGGSHIAEATLDWASEDDAVATVSNGLVTAVGHGSTSIRVEATAEGEVVTGTVDVAVADGALAGVDGGRVAVAGGAAVLDVPAGALSEPVFITADPATDLPAGSVPIAALDFGPDGLVFNEPVTLAMAYDPTGLPPGVSEEDLWLYELVDADFVLVPGSAVDAVNHLVSGPIAGFSVFAVLEVGAPPVLRPTDFCGDYPGNAIVTFEDAALEAEVTGALGLGPEDALTCALAATLTNLELRYSTVADLTGLQNLTGLEEFRLEETDVIDLGPIRTLPDLAEFTLSDTDFTDITPITGLTNLTGLSLEGSFSVTDFSPLSTVTNLESLDLSHTRITDLGPLSTLTRLEDLVLIEATIPDLTPLAGLTGLSTLNLFYNYVLRDIQPLLDNPGIGSGDWVNLGGTLVTCDDVARLQAKGVTVAHDCLRIVTTSLPAAMVDVLYAHALEVAGFGAPYEFDGTWSVVDGALPTGLSLDGAGKISGTPTAAGAFDFVVEYASENGASARRALTLTVVSPPGGASTVDPT